MAVVTNHGGTAPELIGAVPPFAPSIGGFQAGVPARDQSLYRIAVIVDRVKRR
jgi:hypothetical protein